MTGISSAAGKTGHAEGPGRARSGPFGAYFRVGHLRVEVAPSVTSDCSDGDGHFRDFAVLGDHLTVDRLRLRGQRPQRPAAGRREEPEVPGRRRRHLRGELTSCVQQPYVRAADRLLAAQHLALDHRFLVDVHALEVETALLGSAHVSGLSGFVAESNGYADQRTPLGPG